MPARLPYLMRLIVLLISKALKKAAKGVVINELNTVDGRFDARDVEALRRIKLN